MVKIILTLLGLIFFGLLLWTLFSKADFNQMVAKEVKDLREESQKMYTSAPVSEFDLLGLPIPVQRYLKFAKAVQKPRIRFVELQQSGSFRLNPGEDWMPMEATQYYLVDPPGYIWDARIGHFPKAMRVRDRYFDEKAEIYGKLLSTIPLVKSDENYIVQASLQRYLSEMPWFPSSFLSDQISWEPIDENSARCFLRDNKLKVSGIFFFNDEGAITKFHTEERFRDETKKVPWTCIYEDYNNQKGYIIPCSGKAIWSRSDNDQAEDFNYVDIKIKGAEYWPKKENQTVSLQTISNQ